MSNKTPRPTVRNDVASPNQGEGDVESARRYNRSQQEFVNSDRGQAAIEDAGNVDPDELDELEDAERIGLEHVKDEDPAVRRRESESPRRKQ